MTCLRVYLRKPPANPSETSSFLVCTYGEVNFFYLKYHLNTVGLDWQCAIFGKIWLAWTHQYQWLWEYRRASDGTYPDVLFTDHIGTLVKDCVNFIKKCVTVCDTRGIQSSSASKLTSILLPATSGLRCSNMSFSLVMRLLLFIWWHVESFMEGIIQTGGGRPALFTETKASSIIQYLSLSIE